MATLVDLRKRAENGGCMWRVEENAQGCAEALGKLWKREEDLSDAWSLVDAFGNARWRELKLLKRVELRGSLWKYADTP